MAQIHNHFFIFNLGGFYQDEVGGGVIERDGTGCKYCPTGSFIHPLKAPGRDFDECQICPLGMY